jgi:hypothetical protein
MAPAFRSPAFLPVHVAATMRLRHFVRDDGTVSDRSTRHLVNSTRFIFNDATAYRRCGDAGHLAAVRHGVACLRSADRGRHTGGYEWHVAWGQAKRRKKPGPQDGLPDDGRLPRRAARTGGGAMTGLDFPARGQQYFATNG